MGRRGPAPEPTALKVLKGNPGKRPLPENEPRPRAVQPDMPEWLDDVGRKEWRRCVRILMPLGLLTEADGPALATYCHAYATLQAAQKVIGLEGFTTIDARGNETTRPEVGIMKAMMPMIKSFCQEFGMTPSARARMTVPGKSEDEDPMEALLQ